MLDIKDFRIEFNQANLVQSVLVILQASAILLLLLLFFASDASISNIDFSHLIFFLSMLIIISLSDLAAMCKIQENICTKVGPVHLININAKE